MNFRFAILNALLLLLIFIALVPAYRTYSVVNLSTHKQEKEIVSFDFVPIWKLNSGEFAAKPFLALVTAIAAISLLLGILTKRKYCSPRLYFPLLVGFLLIVILFAPHKETNYSTGPMRIVNGQMVSGKLITETVVVFKPVWKNYVSLSVIYPYFFIALFLAIIISAFLSIHLSHETKMMQDGEHNSSS